MSAGKVLFVDDEKSVLAAIARELSDEGYELLFCSSAVEALEVLAHESCKAVVADIKMPKMNGIDFLKWVHELYPDTVRIVLSGHSDIKLILDSVNKCGIDRYLTKPWSSDELKIVLRQAIELFDLRQEVKSLREQTGVRE